MARENIPKTLINPRIYRMKQTSINQRTSEIFVFFLLLKVNIRKGQVAGMYKSECWKFNFITLAILRISSIPNMDTATIQCSHTEGLISFIGESIANTVCILLCLTNVWQFSSEVLVHDIDNFTQFPFVYIRKCSNFQIVVFFSTKL